MSEIKIDKSHMETYLRQRGISLRKAFRCLNPLHEDKHPSMSYNEKAGNVHCFSCGATYDIYDIVGMDYGIDYFPEQLKKVEEMFGSAEAVVSWRREKESLPECPDGAIHIGKKDQLEVLMSGADKSCPYLESRGITRETRERHRFFEKGGRAYMPVFERGVCVSWASRSVNDGVEPRYRNSPGEMGIWNGDLLERHGGGAVLYITEGVIDAAILCQLGREAAAICGSANSGKLLARLRSNLTLANSRRYVLAGDPDDAGTRMNEAIGRGLAEMGLDFEILKLEKTDGDVADLWKNDPVRLRSLLETSDKTSASGYGIVSAGEWVDAFIAESERRAAIGAVATGFQGLDKLLDGGLYPGLYIIGAISSLGKTSFLLQMADYIASSGTDVLLFSLEQSRFELMAKSLSRTSALLDRAARRDAFTVRELLGGGFADSLGRRRLLDEARRIYAANAGRLYVSEGMSDIGAAEVRASVREHKDALGRVPVVMVDYLQILSPSDARATDKQNTDRAVIELKRISRDFDTPVIAVSSFNRENYRSAVSMEAFKESGAVEYSSDVLMGLQLQGAGSAGFDANAAKLREPRLVELVLLKNRSGLPYAKLPMRYTAKFGVFDEAK